MFQRDRGYKLVVGDVTTGEGVAIENLHVTFDINKFADLKKKKQNSAAIEVYNLSEATLKKLEKEFIACEFYCGYEAIGIKRLVYGNVVQVSTRKQGPDKVTQFLLGEGYTALNHQTLSSTVPPGKTVGEALEEIRKQMPGVVRGVFAGTNINNPLVYGYPLTGTPRQMLEEISETYQLEFRIDQGALSVADAGGLTNNSRATAIVLNKFTGLIEIPFYTSPVISRKKGAKVRKTGVNFKALLNTDIVPGAIVKIESDTVNGYYKVSNTRHYGGYRDNDWYVEGFCELPAEGELK